MPMAKNLVELRDVYKIYGEGRESEVRALDGVSLTIGKGEFVAVVGQSGSGKSTMMNVLGCLDIPTRGTYLLGGTDVRELTDKELSHIRNKQIGFIFQQYNLIQSLTVLENVELPLIYQGVNADDRRDMALEALARVGLANRIKHRPVEMSGGQQQGGHCAGHRHQASHHHGRRAHRRTGLPHWAGGAEIPPGAEQGGQHRHSHHP